MELDISKLLKYCNGFYEVVYHELLLLVHQSKNILDEKKSVPARPC